MVRKARWIFSLILLALIIPSAGAEENELPWLDDFDKALTLAELTGKDLLVNFSGSDWCIWCKRLDEEIFSQEGFFARLKENFVPVLLDFPSKKEFKDKVKKPKYNAELKKRFQVQGFPTILLLDSKGKVYAKTGYLKNTPEFYLEHLKQLKAKYPVMKTAVEKAASTEGASKAKAVLGLVDTMNVLKEAGLHFGNNYAHLFPEVNEMMVKALDLDPDNTQGLRLKAALYLLDSSDGGGDKVDRIIRDLDSENTGGHIEKVLRKQVIQNMNKRDGKAAVALIEEFLKDKAFKDQESAAYIHYLGGIACDQMMDDQKEKAAVYYKKALSLTADPALTERVKKYLDKLKADAK